MIPPHPDILTVRDAEILRLLRKIVDMGIWRKQWTAEHVVHVAGRWLVPRDAEVVPLRVVEPKAEPVNPDAIPIEMSQVRADVIRELCVDAPTNSEIADRLGCSTEAVRDRMRWAMRAIGARDRNQAICMVLSGEVRIVVTKPANARKKAS